jgi:hypothetical protein
VSYYFEEGIYALVGATTLATWAVLGLIFWIPFLARSMMLFTGSVLYSTFVGAPEHAEQIRRVLDYAVRFYFNGFHLITDALRKRNGEGGILPPISKISWARVALESIWALLFWAITLGTLTGVVGRIL